MTKMKNIHKRTLGFVFDDYASDFKTLLNKSTNKWYKFGDYGYEELRYSAPLLKFNPVHIKFETSGNVKRYKVKVPLRDPVTFGVLL